MSGRRIAVGGTAAQALAARGDDPLFAEPWEAEAFAVLEALAQAGICSHPEWSRRLTVEIARPGRKIDPDPGRDYYLCWLAALEKLCVEKSLATTGGLKGRKAAWRRAYEATPHGSPVALERSAGRRERAAPQKGHRAHRHADEQGHRRTRGPGQRSKRSSRP